MTEAALPSGNTRKDFQSISIAEEVLLLKQDRHGRQSISSAATSPHVTQKKYHRNLATTRKSTKVTAGVSSGEDTNAEDIGTPQTKITETSLQQDSNANQKHANPYILPHITNQTCSDYQKHSNCG